ncbi:pyruvate dehydrogenase E2 component (dihydrolipoamide acetyltransferase) [Friedmanniella luteola]|uniref:Dihydrolipoamide acetyltransferase component of pyruvate dehydrogenase complex n=1 Tax=Friedmanniella luteola TaxID=546871 RepID=A0A1H2A009_9ACTN|nr:dihydrolipoamide acetyltransferase family protein [Friedmanniella luteola]SDT39338.1 pyruvate dehydrogenase E2 component (dihydrolipoamide acetyltransferase) [Friedmanniella luteola]
MAIREFRLPDPGEGLVEADIVTWRVAVGDTVAVNDILLEIETSKSLVELPSPYAGTVTALLVAEGETADVGAPIIAIDDGAASAAPADAPSAASPTAERVVEPSDGMVGGGDGGRRVPNLVGYGPRTGESKRRPRKAAAADPAPQQAHDQLSGTFATDVPVSRRTDDRAALHAAAPASSTPVAPLPAPGPAAPEPLLRGGPVLAKPPVRKVAKDLGVDLTTVTGTGPGGVITRDDVTAAAAAAAAPAPLVAPPVAATRPQGEGDVRIPVRGVRRATAEAMVRSAFTAPHVTEWLTCDVSASMELLERLKSRREFRDVRISPLLLVTKAVCLALRRTPELNAFWDEPAGEIVQLGSVNLGIAAATPRGLVVPNIKGAQALGLLELAQAINALVATAREGRTQPAEMAGGSFTITNVGTFGVDAGTPILNPGESGILCFGQIARRPWVVGTGADERIEPRWVTTLAVSFDHRLADGAQGSTFLADVAQVLGDPGLGLLF